MSQGGGVFSLVLKDERFDRLFTATDLLAERIRKDPEMSVAGIERTHTMFLQGSYRPYVATASEYTRVKSTGSSHLGASGGACQFKFPSFGHFTSDMVVRLRVSAIGDPAAAGQAGLQPTAATPHLRYSAYPGARALRRVKFHSNSMLVDEYGPDDVMAHRKFFVHPQHRAGWDRCMGQQVARQAAYDGNGYTGAVEYRDGAQTPKFYHGQLELLIPLQFWMCRDPAQALLNDLTPNSQRVIDIEFAALDQLIGASVHDPAAPGERLAVPLPFGQVNIEAELLVNSLYVNPEVHDLFAKRIGFSLIRVHRSHVVPLGSATDAMLLNQLKFPAEYLIAGFRTAALTKNLDLWHLMGRPTPRTNANRLMLPVVTWNAVLAVAELEWRAAHDTGSVDPLVSSIGVTSHGIDIFPELPAQFYNSYLPTRYAAKSLVAAPEDPGAYLLPFCLRPGEYDPSGYFNLSTGREMYLQYQMTREAAAEYAAGGAEMVVSMSALNFIIRRGDVVTLKYSL
jgi:hypothetical protein